MCFDFSMNELFVSIPEEACLLMLCLSFMGAFQFIRIAKNAVIPALFTIFVPSVASNVMRYFLKLDPILILPVFIVIYTATFLSAYRIKGTMQILKVIAFTLLGVAINIILEMACQGLITAGAGLKTADLNDNILLNTVMALPIRILEFSFVCFWIYKYNDKDKDKDKISLYGIIKETKIALYGTSFLLTFFIGYIVVFSKLLIIDGQLATLSISLLAKVTMLTGILITPIISITALFTILYNAKLKDIEQKIRDSETVKTLVSIAESYAISEKYDKLECVLNDMKKL
ncbi:MAG: hypothetical protein Q8876_08020 [Bacillota bacterium]|nr:hypothetical protein [Bacillota bacterium]